MVTDAEWKEVASAAMHRYADGDDAAFDVLYDLLKPRLASFLARRLPTCDRAEELLQETFLLMIRSRGHFACGASVTPWAYAIARRLVIDDLRRRGCAPRIVNEEAAPEPESRDVPADEVLAHRRLVGAIERELATLPEAQREAFELVHHEGLSVPDTAEVLGTTEMAVRLRLHRKPSGNGV